MVQALILLREVLGLLPSFVEALADAPTCPLLAAVRANCQDEGLAALKARIDEVRTRPVARACTHAYMRTHACARARTRIHKHVVAALQHCRCCRHVPLLLACI
jgi:hypothetical protein